MKQLCDITSRNNEKIKSICALREKSSRSEQGLMLIEGIRLVADVLRSGIAVKELFFTESAFNRYKAVLDDYSDCIPYYQLIGDHVAEKLSDTKSSQGVFCVCECPDKKLTIKADGVYILTDNIQNPDNIGAIVRTAEALGIDGIIICGGCDIFSPKPMRASMGGFLRFPSEQIPDAVTAVNLLHSEGIKVCATVPDENAVDITSFKEKKGVCLVIGNEGNGISDEVLSLCDYRLTIRMKGNAESLNAAAAATIAVWEFCR